jgi:hypothetical protein
MHRHLVTLAFMSALVASMATAQSGITLISDDEAKLPPPKTVPNDTRGITRGPKIEVVAPSDPFKSPGPVKLTFQTYGGVNIDANSVRVAYLRATEVDITERIKPFVSGSGIDMPAVTVPAGEHTLRFEIKDSNGRVASKIVTFKTGAAR